LSDGLVFIKSKNENFDRVLVTIIAFLHDWVISFLVFKDMRHRVGSVDKLLTLGGVGFLEDSVDDFLL
jgi:hypothetical protein